MKVVRQKIALFSYDKEEIIKIIQIDTYLRMFLQSKDDEYSQIFCDSCRKMIKQEDYLKHWQPCKTLHTKPQIKTIQKVQKVQIRQQKRQRNQDNDLAVMCNRCYEQVSFDQLEDHSKNCSGFQIQCQHCSTKFQAALLDQHQTNCPNNPNRNNQNRNNQNINGQGIDLQSFAQFLQLMGNNNNNGPSLPMMGLRGLGQNNPRSGLIQSTQQLLSESLFPALMRIDNGMKKRELSSFPTEKYDPEKHRETSCSICQQDFKDEDIVLKIVCSHIQHQSCYKQWLQRNSTCPLCKTNIKSKSKQSK